jgi:hypothetical protein
MNGERKSDARETTRKEPGESTGYEAPEIEKVITPEGLEREVQYGGVITGQGGPP